MKLGDETSIELIKTLSSIPPIIVISSYHEYVAETYRFDAVKDYVLKPLSEDRLLKAIGRVMALSNSPLKDDGKGYCFLKVARKATRFDYDTIDYIESSGANSKIYYEGSYQLTNESISDIEQILPTSFKRVHKSFIANLSKITSLNLETIKIKNSKIPIGISNRPKLMSLL
jgi:DNA-binding LytR/AlgR family response regulator